MPPKNPYENIKITLKEDESRFLLNLLDESKFTRHELDIVDKIYGKLINSTHKREMQIKQSLQNPKNKKPLSPEIIIRAKSEAYHANFGAAELERMEPMTRALIKHTLSGDDATKEKND
jgi:uncharacterized protein YqfA (UPF0365 family)